jgi:hypothetical protein
MVSDLTGQKMRASLASSRHSFIDVSREPNHKSGLRRSKR